MGEVICYFYLQNLAILPAWDTRMLALPGHARWHSRFRLPSRHLPCLECSSCTPITTLYHTPWSRSGLNGWLLLPRLCSVAPRFPAWCSAYHACLAFQCSVSGVGWEIFGGGQKRGGTFESPGVGGSLHRFLSMKAKARLETTTPDYRPLGGGAWIVFAAGLRVVSAWDKTSSPQKLGTATYLK